MDSETPSTSEESFDAISVRNVKKNYNSFRSSFSVLKDINVTVPLGTIYGLLGPSGCGKTTLLRCIVGQMAVDKGKILVLGDPPGTKIPDVRTPKIGYMPQDISLLDRISVLETLEFYGAVAGMSKKQANIRIESLIEFLRLDVCRNRQIINLSGGQKRRVSFAVALLHEPEVLILDEPTVGVDPVLRKSIWDYLTNMTVTRKCSIIITTHYIEEARMAANVGLMLNGEILAEAPPEQLMAKYGCTNLENVFLKLCIEKNDMSNNNDCDNGLSVNVETETKQDKTLTKMQKKNSKHKRKTKLLDSIAMEIPKMYRIAALFIRFFAAFKKYPVYFGFEIILPTILTFVYCMVIGKPIFGLPVGVVNHDTYELGQLFLDKLDTRVIIQVPYDNYEDAKLDVNNGIVWNAIYLNSNFTEAFKKRYVDGGIADNITIDQSSIVRFMDSSNEFVSLAIMSEFHSAFRRFSHETLVGMGLNPMYADVPINYENKQIYGSFDVSYDQFIVPPFFITITFFLLMGMTSIAMVVEKETGSFERMSIMGVLSIELILSMIAINFFVLLAQVFIMMFSAFIIIGYTCLGSIVLLVLLAILQGLCGMSLGIGISSACSSQLMVIGAIIGIYFCSILTEGMVWPIEGMPTVFQYVAYMGPQTYAAEAMRSIMNRGWGLTSSVVMYGFIITIVWTLIFIIFSWIITKFRK